MVLASFCFGPQVLEISDSRHGNQRTAFLSEVKPEETFLSRDYLRAEVKHPGVSGGADRTSQKHFVCVVFCPEPLTATRLLEVPSEKVREPCWLW